MDSTSALVVKVSYGGVLRRFRVPVKANGQLDLDMASLRGKIAALFNLPLDAGFSLTYSDEDGDVVALVDDNDLFDVTNQRLKFLKIDVQLNTGMATNSIATERSGRSSSASGMPDSQNPVAIIQKGINDVMMAVPNPMRDTISKVYIDLTSKAASSSPVVGELFDCISKLGKLSISQEGTPCSPITKPGSSVPSAGEKKDISKKSQTGKKPATSGHVPNSMGVGASFNECPFSGVNGSSPNPMNLNKYPLGVRHSKKGSNDDYWTSSLGVFHKGIQSGISVEPNDNQRTTMRELARQRTQQRQKEEEERARDQRAKALAKLEELNRRSQLAGESSVKNLEAAHNASTPDMPEVPLSHSPASREKKTTVTAEDSIEVTEESGKTLLPSPEDANNEGSTQHDNPPRHHDGAASKQKRLGYKQKQNIVFEKKMAGSSFSEATTEVVDVVPPPEVSNEGVLGHNSVMPAASSVSTESTNTKRKNNRNGNKKKHRVEETTAMNPTRATVGKDSKSGDESTEIGRERAPEMEFGSLSVPSLDIKVSGNSSDQISSFTNEESQSRVKHNWKSQHLRRNPRNSVANKPAEKFAGSSTVIWAPVHPQQKADISTDADSQKTVPEFSTSSKSLHQVQTSSKSKRVEMERYVAKPIVKEMAEQSVSKNPITTAPEMTENVLQKENCGGEGTGILQPSVSAAGKSGSPSKSRHGNGRQGKHGRDHGSPHQRGSVASTKALEDGQFRGTVNYHRNNQTEQIAVGSSKDHTTCKSDGWNDGWYVPPETHSSAAEEVEANGPGTVAVGKDQGMSIHGKQHASRSYKDGGSNYSDLRKANKRDPSKAHMQQSGHGVGQQDLPVASKESRGPEDHVSHTAVNSNVNRGGNHGGREYTRDKTYVSQKRDVAGYGQKMTSADTPAQSQNRSTSKEVQGEHHPNSMFQKNTDHSQRFGRGHHDSQGGWGSSAQENMHHHHHQRPASNRDRQKQNLHYEYKPVGSHTHDGEQQFKDGSQAEGPPRYREKGQGQQRHGGQKMYQQQRGSAGRNTGHGLTDERN